MPRKPKQRVDAKKSKMSEDEKALVRTAMSVIRDMAHDWPTKELLMQPKELVGKLAAMLGETYDFDRGE